MSSVLETIVPARIAQAETLIRPYIRRTPVLEAGGISLKMEQMQHAGSFKTRGAFVNLLSREIPSAGVVAASGGNHGAAIAYAAMTLGIACRIFVPLVSSPAKIARIRAYGAQLVVGGERYADALAASEVYAQESGALRVHAFDQIETILGQGTLAQELEEQQGRVDTVLVPVGGGGLLAGTAAWFAGRARVVAVEPEGAPTLERAFAAGAPVDAPAGSVANDSLAPRRVGELVFPIAQRYVDRVLLVSDEEIIAAREALWENVRAIAEPGGAAAYAAMVSGKYQPAAGERVAVVISGGNAVISWT